MSTEEKVLLSFDYHRHAMRALRATDHEGLLRINGVPYRFTADYALPHLLRVLSDERVYVELRGLPLHLRAHLIVEQLLSPYCVLDYVAPETDSMEDPSVFACYARSQTSIPIPSKIKLKVGEFDGDSFSGSRSRSSLFLNCYTVKLAVWGYTFGQGTGVYDVSARDSDGSVGIVVSPAECHISHKLIDVSLVQKLSRMLILSPREGTPLSDIEAVEAILEDVVFLRVRVRSLDGRRFCCLYLVRQLLVLCMILFMGCSAVRLKLVILLYSIGLLVLVPLGLLC